MSKIPDDRIILIMKRVVPPGSAERRLFFWKYEGIMNNPKNIILQGAEVPEGSCRPSLFLKSWKSMFLRTLSGKPFLTPTVKIRV